jgi:hypothetical protein
MSGRNNIFRNLAGEGAFQKSIGRLSLVVVPLMLVFLGLAFVSYLGAARKERLVSLATGEADGSTLDQVLDRFGKPQYGLAPSSGFVVLWYRVFGNECPGIEGMLKPCYVALRFSARQDCDTSSPACFSLGISEFPVSVRRVRDVWLREERGEWYEFSNPAKGPHTKKLFSGGRLMEFRTDFPPPLAGLKSALGLE